MNQAFLGIPERIAIYEHRVESCKLHAWIYAVIEIGPVQTGSNLPWDFESVQDNENQRWRYFTSSALSHRYIMV